MRKAILVRGLITEEVHSQKYAEYYSTRAWPWRVPVKGEDTMLLLDKNIACDHHIVPVHRFCRTGNLDTYVAYSHEIEELLGIPIQAMTKQIDNLSSELEIQRIVHSRLTSKYVCYRQKLDAMWNMTLWDKIKFLFGKLPKGGA